MSKFKSGRFSRALDLGKSLTKAGAHLALSKVATKASEGGENIRKIMAAREIIRSMGELKGAFMKLGQMLSLTDDLILPAEVSALFRSLQKDSKRMSHEELLLMFEQEFQCSPHELFASFNEKAMAAASIGQVHRAVLKSGQQVAVKIQYPAIEAAIRADFANLDRLEELITLLIPKRPDIRPMLEELRRSMIEECDYHQEGQSMVQFKADLALEFAQIKVPQYFKEYSSRAILTTEFVSGYTFDEALEFSQAERNFLCQTLYDQHMFGLYEKRLLHTDPQNGNYLFTPSQVILLDFGSTRAFDAEFIASYARLLYAVEENLFDLYYEEARKLGLFMSSDTKDLVRDHFVMIQKLYLPYTREGRYPCPDHNPFELLKEFLSGVSLKGRQGPREEFLLLDRANLGFYAKIRKLGGVIDWRTSRDKYRAKWLANI